jgi:two-component system response regulator NreC
MTLKKQNCFSSQDRIKNIFIVDDHPIVREGIGQLVNRESDMKLVGEAGDFQQAISLLEMIKIDLAIVDISIRGGNGIDLTKTLLSLYPQLPILIMSMHDESLYVERVLKAGAKGYLVKQEATDHVITAIRKVLGGEVYMSEEMKEILVKKFITNGKNSNEHSIGSLTDRELEVLELISQGLSTRQISEALHVSMKTIDSHYANIKNKLDLKNAHELIQYAVKWSLVA